MFTQHPNKTLNYPIMHHYWHKVSYHILINVIDNYMLSLSEVQMWELTKIVIPKITANWEDLAYCMRYTVEEVEGFRRDSQDLKDCCRKLLINWLTTDHVPKHKTYHTLLKQIKKIDGLRAASETIEKELIEGMMNK